jgi:23S rRNA-/tRNA-specific pseudouridylate synthase
LNKKQKQVKVTEEYEGKRLRWFIQHGIQGLSKKKAEISIQGCLVIINDSVVLDSSRILASGDTILVSLADSTNSSAGPKLEFLHRKAPILVVFKPAGMRTKGQFPNTLESTISQQEGYVYYSLSPLYISCAGLCALIQTGHERIRR